MDYHTLLCFPIPEVFHSLYNVYCPKRLSFPYECMYARTQLCTLDHDSGIHRNQSTTSDGNLCFKTVYSKVSASCVAKLILEDKNILYWDDIMKTIRQVSSNSNIIAPTSECVPKRLVRKTTMGKKKLTLRDFLARNRMTDWNSIFNIHCVNL